VPEHVGVGRRGSWSRTRWRPRPAARWHGGRPGRLAAALLPGRCAPASPADPAAARRPSATAGSCDHQVTGVWQGLIMPTLSEDLAFRGLIHQVTDPALLERLDAGGLTVYAGFDPPPTASRGQPAPTLHAAPFPAGRPSSHLPGRRGHRDDRGPGRQAGRARPVDPGGARGLPRGIRPSWANSSTCPTPSSSTTAPG
jgi:hypothetical protein